MKASRFLTHMRKLKDPAEPLRRFLSRARRLGPALGPVLFQLPPHWSLNLERLHAFLKVLHPAYRYAIEFRDPSWYDDRALDLLEQHGVALCLHDMMGSASGRRRIGPFTYVRFHGTSRYNGSYGKLAIESWGQWLASELIAGRPVHAYFNNDIGGHAPRDAARLRTAVLRKWTALTSAR